MQEAETLQSLTRLHQQCWETTGKVVAENCRVVQLLSTCWFENRFCLVFERLDGTLLEQVPLKHPGGDLVVAENPIPLSTIREVVVQVLSSLLLLYRQNMVCRHDGPSGYFACAQTILTE